MEHPKITGLEDYQKFYHMSSAGLVWLGKKGNSIPLLQLLYMHVETIDPSELWNSIEMQNKVHKQNFAAPGTGPTNSTTIDAKVPILTTPTSPIMECHDEVRHPESSSIATVKDLLEDPQIQPGMMQSALSTVTSLFTPSKLSYAGGNNPVVTNNTPVGSTPNVGTNDVHRELIIYRKRLALELTNFKKQLETQSHIEVECAKQNLKLEFKHELHTRLWFRQRQLMHYNIKLTSWGHGFSSSRWLHAHCCPRLPHSWIQLYLPSHPCIITSSQCYHLLAALVEVMDMLYRFMTNQYAILQETPRQSQSAYKEHYLSSAQSCDGRDPQ